MVEKQGAERRAAVLQLQRLLRTADGLTTAASLGSFDDTEDDDLALAEPQPPERRALAALAAGLWARHPAARRRADARARRAPRRRAPTTGAPAARARRAGARRCRRRRRRAATVLGRSSACRRWRTGGWLIEETACASSLWRAVARPPARRRHVREPRTRQRGGPIFSAHAPPPRRRRLFGRPVTRMILQIRAACARWPTTRRDALDVGRGIVA